jgi:hypothetical protein
LTYYLFNYEGPPQHSLILPVTGITLALTNVGLATSPHAGSDAHCTSLVAINILPLVPEDINVLCVEASL